ncbi:MFS transporter [Candidatus Poriferisodalis sp.]|uniref:MFS transporter n=1 Tax=Candidatus Poriferisodalis sp. TaxID=3101277 RepID=UPI003B593E0D
MRNEVDPGQVDLTRVRRVPRVATAAATIERRDGADAGDLQDRNRSISPPRTAPADALVPPGRPRAREAVSGRAWRALTVASLGTVLVGFNSTATNIALNAIQESYAGATAADVGWGIAGYMIGTAAFLPLAGRLADRIGRKLIFQTGLVLFALSAVASALAPTVWTLNLARVLQAVGGAAILPASLSLVLPLFPASRRTTAVGLWSAAGPLAAGIAPGVAAVLLGVAGWRVVYFVSAPVAALMFLVAWRILKELPTPEISHRLDVTGAAAGTVGLAALVTAIMQGSRVWGWTSPVTLVVAAVGLGAFAWFVKNSLRHPEPLLNLHLLRRRGVWVTQLSNFLVGVSSQAIWLIWPLFMFNFWDYSENQVGLGVTVGPIVAGASTVFFSRLGERWSAITLCRTGAAIQILAIGWQVLRLGTEADYLREMAPTIALFGLGWGMCVPLLNSVALAWVDESYFGEISGLFNTLRYAASAIGIAGLFALLKDASGEGALVYYQHVLAFFLVFAIAAFLSLWIPIGRPDRTHS